MTLTQRDLDQIEKVVDGQLKEKLKNLPSKNEFFTSMDKLMGEVKAMREDFTAHQGAHDRQQETLEGHEKRIVSLEKQKFA